MKRRMLHFYHSQFFVCNASWNYKDMNYKKHTIVSLYLENPKLLITQTNTRIPDVYLSEFGHVVCGPSF